MAHTTPSSSLPKTRLTVLISGSGTNLQALIDALSTTLAHCTIVRVISNRKSAFGLQRAKKAGIPTEYHNLTPYYKEHRQSKDDTAGEEKARTLYDTDLASIILKDDPNVIVCAGWMHILRSEALDPLQKAGVDIINLHPALPGEYNGANAIERAHADLVAGKSTRTGVMVHYVIAAVDMGKPILTKEIPFEEGDKEEGGLQRLEQRIHEVEWAVIVEGTRRAVESYWQRSGKAEHAAATN